MANRLAREQSPYLLQHQDNPVDWYPWGEEAFARARATGRPIFLSIGYSTCHWCHVMAHESFESPEIADVLNRHFVAVKVDREERPDVDRVYMTFVQATTGSGGWPMSVWLTPELEPFYGATYFPPTSRWGRPGFIDVLNEIARAWREERPRVVASAASILDRLRALNGAEAGDRSPGADELARTVAEFAERFDQQRGGFGGAPKFPRPSELLFLFREHARTGAEAPAMMALRTLEAMADGGMRDQIGGGFHRYSVDAEWRVPHFEKMLYDQAQLVLAYLEATQVTRAARYGVVAAHTLAYVVRDLSDPAGGFHSAEDADSVPAAATGAAAHPREGAFYVWTEAEMREVLGEDAAVAIARFGVKPGGNAPADPQGEFAGQNILYVARSIEEVAASTGRPVLEVTGALTRVRQALFDARHGRPAPHLDDKVLTAWNGLMIGALARAARVLPDGAGSLRAAVRAAEFLRTTVWDAQTERLFRRYRRGEVGVAAYAEDYAYLIFGLLELFQTTGSVTWLEWALTLQRQQDALFWDDAGGGWFSTTGDDPSVLLRLKDDYDGAEPAASSVGAANLLMLAHLTGDAGWGERVDAVFRMYASRLATSGRTVPMLLSALSVRESGIVQVVVVGEPGEPAFDGMLRVVRSQYLPQAIVVPVSVAERPALEALLPWTAVLRVPAGESRAFVCREFTCNQPCATPEELLAQLDALRPDPR